MKRFPRRGGMTSFQPPLHSKSESLFAHAQQGWSVFYVVVQSARAAFTVAVQLAVVAVSVLAQLTVAVFRAPAHLLEPQFCTFSICWSSSYGEKVFWGCIYCYCSAGLYSLTVLAQLLTMLAQSGWILLNFLYLLCLFSWLGQCQLCFLGQVRQRLL